MVALSDQVKRRLARYLPHYGGHLDDRFLRFLLEIFFGLNVFGGCTRICKEIVEYRYIKKEVVILYSWSFIGQFKLFYSIGHWWCGMARRFSLGMHRRSSETWSHLSHVIESLAP